MKRSLPFVLAASDHGPLIVNRFDRATVNGASYGVGYQVLETGSYDPEDVSFILNLLSDLKNEKPGELLVVDCGANIGVISLEMGHHMAGWGRVVAFEAQEWLFYALCGNIALANAFNVTARFAAVGETRGSIDIPRPNYATAGSFGSLEFRRRPETEYIGQSISYAPKDLVAVPMISIDSLSFPRLDFMKIDVEGMEIEILRGAQQTIDSFRPALWIEWIKSDRAELKAFLNQFDYTIVEVGANLLATHEKEP